MDYFTTDPQIEELDSFGFYDEEETKQTIEDYYDDLSFGLPLDSSNDF
jgi:hypothetical protein